MTFSIVAFDPKTGDLGVAVQSKFPCVGSVVPWAKSNVGAIATQAFVNTTYGPRGLKLLEEGFSASEVLSKLLEDDDLREQRQVGIIDAKGNAVAFTGKECFYWAGQVVGANFSCQGNILVSDETVKSMASAFNETEGDLADKLLAVLTAADEEGRGDVRGKQSASLLIVREKGGYGGYTDIMVDIRVDDHKEPIKGRPVVAARDSEGYMLSKILAYILKPTLVKVRSHLESTQKFIESITQITLESDEVFGSFDVVNLYGSIPLSGEEDAVTIATAFYDEHRLLSRAPGIPTNCMKELLTLSLHNSVIGINGAGTYKQVDGLAMGNPLSGLISTIYMNYVETKVRIVLGFEPKYWKRYVDDIFYVGKMKLEEARVRLNTISQHIQFTMEEPENSSMPFLDTKVTVESDGRFSMEFQ